MRPVWAYKTRRKQPKRKEAYGTFNNIFDDPTFFTCERLNGQNYKREGSHPS